MSKRTPVCLLVYETKKCQLTCSDKADILGAGGRFIILIVVLVLVYISTWQF